MFGNLVESRSKQVRRPGGMILSFVSHYGFILAAIYTSAQAATVNEGPRQEKIEFIEQAEPEVKPAQPAPPELIAAPPAPKSVPLLIAPLEVPSVLPDIDLSVRPTDPNDFVRRATTPVEPGAGVKTTAPTADNSYFAFQVEKPAAQAPNSATPAYPDILRQAGVEGEALVSFVVDTAGRIDVASFKVVRSTHELFAVAVRNALPRMRFLPAEIGDRKVRQLVQQPFSFAIVK